ncbi:MAG: glycosyltransferase [Chitinivibrionales bacterium]|nr:glycosyltransferase [Chitinivibrionales bacterium]
MRRRDYVVVTPVRDEEDHLEQTIHSVADQEVRPRRWVIVDDGSSDSTLRIAEAHAERLPWLEVVHRPDRGYRKAGGGVVEAFYEGYRRIESLKWDYIVKLDGDVSFTPDYFRRLLEHFERDASLGIAGGEVYSPSPTGPRLEPQPAFHVRGATKVYSRACWLAIGGLMPAPGWDTLDEVKANMLGFRTRSLPDLQVYQHRATGGADGAWRNYLKNGRANYISGYHPLFILAKCVRRFFAPPFAVASIALFTGYWGCHIRHERRLADERLVRYLRRQQVNRLLLRPSIWY